MTAAAKPAAHGKGRRTFSDLVYGCLLSAYPAALREEFADEMVGMFRAQRLAASGDPLRRIRLWVLAIVDVLVHATAERRANRTSPGDERSPHGGGPRRRLSATARALADDLRYALRALTRRPKFTSLALAILTIGVGTSTAVFGVVDATMLRPLPYANADRLVDLWTFLPDGGFTINGIRLDAVRAWREQPAIFEQVEGYDRRSALISGDGEPRRVVGALISPGLLEMLGVTPVLGRGFAPDEGVAGSAPVVLISEGMWRQRFGGDTTVLGKDLELDDELHTIVGVLPAAFRFPALATETWRPMSLAPNSGWEDTFNANAVGRLRAGLSHEAAQQLANATADQWEDVPAFPYMRLQPWEDLRANPGTRSSLLMLLGAVGFLALIATANLANLLLAQTSMRRNEIAIRTALGAARARVARQLLTESALLALAGGVLGTLLGTWLLSVAMNLLPSRIANSLASEAVVDGRSMVFATVLALTIGLAMGVFPAASARWGSRTANGVGMRSSAPRRQTRTRNALVVIEVALSLLLLVGAGLMVNSFSRLQMIDPGFDADNLLLVELQLDPNRYASETERMQMADELDALLEQLPGVVGATVGGGAPPVPGGVSFGIAPEAEGMPAAPPIEHLVLAYGHVAPDYFAVVDIPFTTGRTFSPPGDQGEAAIVINETVAKHYWGDVSPIGTRFRLEPEDEWRTVVGVVADVRASSPDDPFGSMEIYYPFEGATKSPPYRTFAVRTEGDPLALVEPIKSQVWALDRNQPVAFQLATDVLAERVEGPRFYLQLIGAFAAIAAALAALGIYGVLSYNVGQRLHEIGIRMALGESERAVLRHVVAGGLKLTCIGVVLGLAGAAMLSRYLESLLYAVSPIDLPTFAAAAMLMLAVAGVACWLPARRATRVDPVEALRAE